MRNRISTTVLTLAFAASCVAAAQADQFSFSTGSPDGKLGALSRPAGSQGVETETADDFVLTQPTVVSGATVHGLVTGAAVSNITRVEVEIYHIFSIDSDINRTANVPTRTNSPSDHEISTATRDSNDGTVSFVASDAQFTPKTVETAEEREKLIFRIKLQVDPKVLDKYHTEVKTGVRGIGFVRVGPNVTWPDTLAVKLPQ